MSDTKDWMEKVKGPSTSSSGASGTSPSSKRKVPDGYVWVEGTTIVHETDDGIRDDMDLLEDMIDGTKHLTQQQQQDILKNIGEVLIEVGQNIKNSKI